MSERIIVVGAGVSGLAAAYRLKQRGFEVTVLEKSDYVGGKARTITKQGYLIDEGASVLPSKYSNVIGIVRELGLQDQLSPGGFDRRIRARRPDSLHGFGAPDPRCHRRQADFDRLQAAHAGGGDRQPENPPEAEL